MWRISEALYAWVSRSHVSRGVVYIERLRRYRVVILADARAVSSLQSVGFIGPGCSAKQPYNSLGINTLVADARAVSSLQSGGGYWTRLLHEAALQSARNQIVIGGRKSRDVPTIRGRLLDPAAPRSSFTICGRSGCWWRFSG